MTSAGSAFHEVPNRNDDPVEVNLGVGQNLVDELIGPWGFDHIGHVRGNFAERQVLEAGLRSLIECRALAVTRQVGVQSGGIQITNQKTGSRPAGSSDQKMMAHLKFAAGIRRMRLIGPLESRGDWSPKAPITPEMNR